jgi:hypothetical protein
MSAIFASVNRAAVERVRARNRCMPQPLSSRYTPTGAWFIQAKGAGG